MSEIYIFGAGIQGQLFLNAFQSTGHTITGFVDDYSNCDTYNGLPVLRTENLKNKQASIYISIGLISPKIKSALQSQGFENVFDFTQSVLEHPAIIHELKAYSLWYSSTPSDMIDAVGIAKLRRLLSDEKSQILLDRIIAFRTDFSAGHYVVPDANTQYFPDDIDVFSTIDSVRFVDAGAYNGDTVTALIQACTQQNIRFEYAACFEPDPTNLLALTNKVADLQYKGKPPRVFTYPAAAWRKSEMLEFNADQAASSCIADAAMPPASSKAIFGLSIDQCLLTAAPNFIKMDIEGAERSALIGSQQIIQTYRPVLAVCLYHRPSDLWELPLFIHELMSDYDMYLRVYGDMLLETVLYCIPRSRA